MSSENNVTATAATEGTGDETPETEDPDTATPLTEETDGETTEAANTAAVTEGFETASPETEAADTAIEENEGGDTAAPPTEGPGNDKTSETVDVIGHSLEADVATANASNESASKDVKSSVSEPGKPLEETPNVKVDATKSNNPALYNPSCRCRDCPVLEAARAMIARQANEEASPTENTQEDQNKVPDSDQTTEPQIELSTEPQINESAEPQEEEVPETQLDQPTEAEAPPISEVFQAKEF